MTRTALYRHVDAAGQLLYVGISLSAVQRLGQHRDTSGWYGDIASVTIEWLSDRNTALAAEAIAIARENPKHNRSRPFVAPAERSPGTWAVEHVKSLRRDGNYDEENARAALAEWEYSFPNDAFRLVSAPAGQTGGATAFHSPLRYWTIAGAST